METRYILSSDNPVNSTENTSNDAYNRKETAGRAKWTTDTANHKGINFFTTLKNDKVDCITVTPKATYSVEIKNLRSDLDDPKYFSSQLYEENKRKHQQHLSDAFGYKPLYVRYFKNGRIVVKLSDVDFTDYVTIDNPENAKNNSLVTAEINKACDGGKLVRCHNYWATKSTVKSRFDKIQKDVWFIPNRFTLTEIY